MGRTIDENSVIDIVTYECGEWTGLAKEIEKQIRSLPSAQTNLQPTCNQLATDCVSRQAAMNAFAERVKRSNNSDFAPVPRWNDAVEIVENLPSVDAVKVIRCKDCKYSIDFYDDGDCYCRRPRRSLEWIGDWDFYCKAAERRQDG